MESHLGESVNLLRSSYCSMHSLRWRVLMNIINECRFYFFIFFAMLTSDNKQTAVTTLHHHQLAVKVNNRVSTLRLARVQPRVKTAVCDGSFSRARFHATADRYRCFFSGWPHNYAWITCFSARKSLKQRIGTSTHTVLYPTEVFFASWAKRMHSFVGGV